MTGDEPEVPILVFAAMGPIGFVIRFTDGDWESYRICGLELHGRHRTKAEAAAALAALGKYGAEEH
jgi:hypothetical protein